MNRRPTLSLKRETLTELTTAELDIVVGGSHTCVCTVTHGPSLDEACPEPPTLPLFPCLSDLGCQTR